jgi:hypothetical protein
MTNNDREKRKYKIEMWNELLTVLVVVGWWGKQSGLDGPSFMTSM